jgi:lipoprotein NlpI
MAQSDFDRAIELDPRDPSALLNRGMFHYVGGRQKASQDDFAKAAQLEPRNPYAAIWQYLANHAEGDPQAAKTQLEAFLSAEKNLDAWPVPIARYLVGQISGKEVLDAAPLPDDVPRTAERTAEANFYLGESYRIQDRTDESKAAWTKAISQSVPRSQEFLLANIRLTGWQKPVPPPPRALVIRAEEE